MDRIARLPARERAELFRRSAATLYPERSPVIVEKDFWVCWTLHRIYEVIRLHPHLVFKGGTSLSKAYAAIRRFSEDVDLTLSRRDLGFADDLDPEQADISGKERTRRIKALVARCEQVIRDEFLPTLRRDFSSVLGARGWRVELDARDSQTLIFTYPGSMLPKGAVRPAVKLEMGARSDDWPTQRCSISPYAAEAFPDVFETPSCQVDALDARRTFWEKVTLVHAEYHRPVQKPTPEGQSRHYYDLHQLSLGHIGEEACRDLDLLARVVKHKRLFFSSAWARYETAVPGSIRLVPAASREDDLRVDYGRMREMLFGLYPTWEEIVAGIRELENRLNRT